MLKKIWRIQSLVFLLILSPFFMKITMDSGESKIKALTHGWKCKAGNDKQYADLHYDDQNWKPVTLPAQWVILGFYDSVVWCRLTFEKGTLDGESMYRLFLINIVNGHEVYWNGQKVGAKGVLDEHGNLLQPNPSPVVYTLSKKHFQKDKNIISIKILDQDKAGGIYAAPILGDSDSLYSTVFLWFMKNGGFSIFFLFIGLYYGILYLENRQEKYVLFFSIICISNGINSLAYYKIIYLFIENFYINYIIFHGCFFLTVMLIPFFLSSLFKFKLDLYSKFIISMYVFFCVFFLLSLIQADIRSVFRNYGFPFVITGMNLLLGIEFFRIIIKVSKTKLPGYQYYVFGSYIAGFVIYLSIIRFFTDFISEIFLMEGLMSYVICIALSVSSRSRGALEELAKIREEYGFELEREVNLKTQELAAVNFELQNTNLLKDKLFSILAHDLRTPIQSLQDLLNLATDSNLSRTRFKQEIKNVSLSLYNNKFLLENLLHWISSQMQTQELNIQTVQIRSLFFEIQLMFEALAKKKKVTFDFQVEDLLCQADPDVLRIVLRNLISNSIKFSLPNSKIILGAKENDRLGEIFVQDFGMGLNESEQRNLLNKKILEGKRGTANEVGLGLGLYLCQEFMKKMNSEIFFSSQKDLGTRFYFHLPLIKEK